MRFSLKTGYVSEAKDKAQVIAGQIKHLFMALRKDRFGNMAKLTDKKLNEIVRSIINGHLEWFEEETLGRIVHDVGGDGALVAGHGHRDA